MAASDEIERILGRVTVRISSVAGVAALVLGGSQARGTADERSDIDLGLYYDSRSPFRIASLARVARELDDRGDMVSLTGFGDWGPGVNGGGWLIVGGRHVDLLYRNLNAVKTAIAQCRRGEVSIAYQLGHPCGFHNQIYAGEVSCCRPLFDPRGILGRLKRGVARYPPALRTAIVKEHLFDAAFELAIAAKAVARRDTMYVTGCLFRAAGFMTFMLYALNRKWLINEKGAMAAAVGFPICPADFHATVEGVLAKAGRSPSALANSVERMRSVCGELAAIAMEHRIEALMP